MVLKVQEQANQPLQASGILLAQDNKKNPGDDRLLIHSPLHRRTVNSRPSRHVHLNGEPIFRF